MNLTGTYKFENWDLEITNPELEILQDTLAIHPSQMTISVNIILKYNNFKFGYGLKEIQVENLEYNEGELVERVLTRLEDFKI